MLVWRSGSAAGRGEFLRPRQGVEQRHLDIEQHDIRRALRPHPNGVATVDSGSNDLVLRHLPEHEEEQFE
jgi:hypothetical protein